jgi:hypothetical protein
VRNREQFTWTITTATQTILRLVELRDSKVRNREQFTWTLTTATQTILRLVELRHSKVRNIVQFTWTLPRAEVGTVPTYLASNFSMYFVVFTLGT